MSNPFDLRRPIIKLHKAEPQVDRTSKDKLQGYSSVDKSRWKDIPIGTHVRYVRKTGEFRSGGFVKQITRNSSGDSMIILENDKINRGSSRYKTFPIILKDIDKIYQKELPGQLRHHQSDSESEVESPRRERHEKDVKDFDGMAKNTFAEVFRSEIRRLEKMIEHQDKQMSKMRGDIKNLVELVSIITRKR
jgi:hypothetical protein